jgi:hypothetical protein
MLARESGEKHEAERTGGVGDDEMRLVRVGERLLVLLARPADHERCGVGVRFGGEDELQIGSGGLPQPRVHRPDSQGCVVDSVKVSVLL